MNSSILVPTDFSEAANKALQHAVLMSKNSGAKIYLLNLCKSTSEIPSAKINLEKQAGTIENLEQIVRVGDFKAIPKISKELSVEMIFLGTHGASGMQKVMGSNALKLVTNSEVPFIIVQKDSPNPNGYKKIMVPTSFHFENKQKIMAVAALAKYFGSKIYFIYNDSDVLMKKKSLQNLNGMKKFLDSKGLSYDEVISTGKNFNQDTLVSAANIGAELIAIMNMQKNDLLGTGLFGKNYEQELIMNDQKIPILILNPKTTQLLGNTLG